jgi:DNA polymerase sigma
MRKQLLILSKPEEATKRSLHNLSDDSNAEEVRAWLTENLRQLLKDLAIEERDTKNRQLQGAVQVLHDILGVMEQNKLRLIS